MKKATKTILFALTAVLLFAAVIQQGCHWWDFKPLAGVIEEQPLPKLTYESYGNSRFQQQFETYLKQHFGFREPLIRFYNQYLWDFYHKSPIEGSRIAFGKDDWIYEPWGVTDHYGDLYHNHAIDSTQMAEKLTAEAERLLQLQQTFEEYGVHLFVCMVPSKDMIYPEYLPENKNTKYKDEPKMSARAFNKQAYARLGINVLDLEQYFLDIKDTADFALFPKTGIHWTKYASLYAADTLIRYMEHLGDVNIRNLVIGPRELDDARDPDDDLESLMNLIRPLPKPQYWYATTSTDHDATAVKPKVIVVGDSFWWNVAVQIPLNDLFSSAAYWYYNSTVYYYPPFNAVNELNVEEELLTADFIILFYNAATQYRMNDGFSQQALKALNYTLDTAAYIEQQIELTANIIRITPQWAASVEEKAEKLGITFEQALRKNAEWTVNHKIQQGTMEWPQVTHTLDTAAFIEHQIQGTIQKITASPEWTQMIREKAEKNGKDFDQALRADAEWVVYHQLETGALAWPQIKQKQ